MAASEVTLEGIIMEWWMHQGTTMRYNDVAKDFFFCGKYGFSAIELKYNMVRNYSAEYIKNLSNQNNVAIGSLTGIMLPVLQIGNVKQQSKKRFANMCSFAKKVNAEFVVAYPARGKTNEDRNLIEEDIIDILKEYSDIADEYNIKIAIEVIGYNDSYLNNISDGLRIINIMQRECLGLVYDFYHMYGTEDLGKAICLTENNRIFIVHIGDGHRCKCGKYLDANRLWPGEGDAGILEQLKIMRKIRYMGPCSLEIYNHTPWVFDMETCYRIAKEKAEWVEDCLK